MIWQLLRNRTFPNLFKSLIKNVKYVNLKIMKQLIEKNVFISSLLRLWQVSLAKRFNHSVKWGISRTCTDWAFCCIVQILSSNLFCGSYEAVPYVEKEGQWLEIKRINNQIFIYEILSHEKKTSSTDSTAIKLPKMKFRKLTVGLERFWAS